MDGIRLSDLPERAGLGSHSFAIATPSSDEFCADSFLTDSENAFKASWWSLFTFTNKRHSMVLAIALLLSVISGLVIPGMSILLGEIFGAFAGFGSGALSSDAFMEQLTKAIVCLALLGCASWLLNGAFFASWLWFGELQAKAAREKMFENLISQDVEWFEERKNGVSAMLSKNQT
jgi:ATP-binding cassette subfamily B (MDR/TAP) protein 1